MIKKLTMKTWISMGPVLLVCLAITVAALWHYAPSALVALRGGSPMVNESLSNIYGMTVLGLVMLVISLVVLIKMLLNPVGKRVNRYLEKHPGVTMEQLDEAFESAEKVENVWIGGRWTFSHELWCIVVENAEIVRAYSQRERAKRDTNYFLCLEFTEEKNDRVKMSYHSLSQILEMYRKYPNIQVENNL